MISTKQWGVLLLVYLFYLLSGAFVFLALEAKHELDKLEDTLILQKRLSINLHFIEEEAVRDEIRSIVLQLEDSIGKDLLITEDFQEVLLRHIVPKEELPPDNLQYNSSELLEEVVPQLRNVSSNLTDLKGEFLDRHPLDLAVVNENAMWTLWNAFFFSFTAITTIGFGHMSPSTDGGRLFCIIYSLLGVPLNGILFASLADLFSWKFIEKIDGDGTRSTKTIFAATILYLVPGLLVLIILPSVMFMYVEGWSFLVSIYFSFISLMTIGFGDFVAGYPFASGSWLWAYRTCIMIWLILGLGYLFMVIAFIQRALRSEEVRALDRTMKNAFKDKVLAMHMNVTKDLDKLRTALDGLAKASKAQASMNEAENQQATNEENDAKPSVTGSGSRSLSSRKNDRRKSEVDVFLELAGSILQESEEGLEATVGHYNQALDTIDESDIDENENEFKAEIPFPPTKMEEGELKKPQGRRASIWVSSTPTTTFNLPEPEASPRNKKKMKALSNLLEKVRSFTEDKPKTRSVASRRPTMYPTLDQRLPSDTDESDDSGDRSTTISIESQKRRKSSTDSNAKPKNTRKSSADHGQ